MQAYAFKLLGPGFKPFLSWSFYSMYIKLLSKWQSKSTLPVLISQWLFEGYSFWSLRCHALLALTLLSLSNTLTSQRRKSGCSEHYLKIATKRSFELTGNCRVILIQSYTQYVSVLYCGVAGWRGCEETGENSLPSFFMSHSFNSSLYTFKTHFFILFL